jgi:hypothetical protein
VPLPLFNFLLELLLLLDDLLPLVLRLSGFEEELGGDFATLYLLFTSGSIAITLLPSWDIDEVISFVTRLSCAATSINCCLTASALSSNCPV